MEKQDIYKILGEGCPHETWNDSVCPNCAKEILGFLQERDRNDFSNIFQVPAVPDSYGR